MTTVHELPPLAAAFGPTGREDWLALVAKTLKGADFQRRLVSKTYDNLALEPIYARRADTAAIAGAGAGKPWGIVARADHPKPAEAAALALADLEGGADGLALAFAGSPTARGFGLAAGTVADLDASLGDVMIDLIHMRIEPAPAGRINAALVAALVERRKHDPARLSVNFGLDPLAMLASTRSTTTVWTETGRQLAQTITALKARDFRGPFIACDLRWLSEAGASEAQELAVGLASGIAYARALEAQGMPVTDAFAALSWTIAIDADQFAGIAKLRALRRLWARVEEVSGVASQPISIHAETAWRMMTRRDPAVNMLRSTLATFAAAAGGADSIAVLPHTQAVGLPDTLARRIARNTQLVLQEETNLWRVADPAAGSGAIEALTDQLCEKAWALFQDIEREGGLAASLASGRIQDRIEVVRKARFQDIATRRSPITGTSEFPNLAEVSAAVLDIAPDAMRATPPIESQASTIVFDSLVKSFAKGGTRTDVAQPSSVAGPRAAHVVPQRLAEPFEILRDAADAATKAAGKRPRVFLANLGPLAEFGARASWISNLLAAGGIEAISNDGFTASGEAGAAFAASGAAIACICGADSTYDLLAEATAMALKSAGASRVLLAGKPGASAAALSAAGVDQFVFAGQDVIAALQQLHQSLGIAAA